MPFIMPSVERAKISPEFFQAIPLIVESLPELNVNSVAGVVAHKVNSKIGKTIESMNMFSIIIPTGMLDDLAAIDGIRSISLDRKHHAFEIPSYPEFLPSKLREVLSSKDGMIPTTQSFNKINVDMLNNLGYQGNGVQVGVLDTGIDIANPQVRGRAIKKSTMAIQPTGDDENGHGSHVATTIFGLEHKDPLTGLISRGGAPKCALTSYKVLGLGIGTGMTSDIMAAMEMAVNDGNQVINMSLGSEGAEDEESDPMVRMINDYAEFHPEVIFCVAAGNSGPGSKTIGIPACAEKALTVGAWGVIDNYPAYFSSRGPTVQANRIKPDICAPGGGRRESQLRPKENIWSGTSFGSILDPAGDDVINGFCAIAGTSMATPHITAVMALWKEIFPELTTDMVKGIIKSMSGQGKNSVDGYGLIDATWILSASETPRITNTKQNDAQMKQTAQTLFM